MKVGIIKTNTGDYEVVTGVEEIEFGVLVDADNFGFTLKVGGDVRIYYDMDAFVENVVGDDAEL